MAEKVKAEKAKTVKKAETTAKPRKAAVKKSAAVSNLTQMAAPAESNGHSFDDVAKLAHRYWAERGHKHGHHVEDWLRAEQELRGKAS